MSTNLIHVFTIIGSAASELEAVCDQLVSKRKTADPACFASDDWSRKDQKKFSLLCQKLIRSSRRLPVMYYAQYLDAWSVANSRFSLLKWDDGKRRQISAPDFGMVFYPTEFCKSIVAQVRGRQRTKLYRTQSEDRWYLDHMVEAAKANSWLKAERLVVSISEYIGEGSRDDDTIKAALNAPLKVNVEKASTIAGV
jgi:hypothetical protein